jgi:hypothetical protein
MAKEKKNMISRFESSFNEAIRATFPINNQLQEVRNLTTKPLALYKQSLVFKEEQTDLSDIDNKALLIQRKQFNNDWERNGLGKWVQVWQKNLLSR